MSFLLAFLGFALLIILHEFGHFTAAKAVGMRVERFSLFFPPLIARKRRGETEYAIGSIPLGGYVRITGMNPLEEIPPQVAHRAYFRQPVWKRIVVIGAGPAVNIVLAFVILWALLVISGIQVPTESVGPVDAAGRSVSEMWFFTRKTVETIANIFNAQKRKEISGVVGSYEVTRQTIELSTERAIYLLAIISLSLGVINLFPFLPLDGGHIFWALAEKVRGRAIPFSVMERAGFIGFVLVIGLFMIGFTNDIGRLTGEGFGVR